MKNTLLTTAFVFGTLFSVMSQNFNYSFSSGTGTYTNLSEATVITTGAWAGHTYRIPIGFSFNFLGKAFDSLAINPDRGFLVFDENGNYALTAFKGVAAKESGTVVSYKLESGVFKIEFKNCHYPLGNNTGDLSFQLWLYQQDGKVEIRTGANSYSSENEFPQPLVGLINLNQDSDTSAVMLKGNPSQPEKQDMNIGGELSVLDAVPAEGSIYIFTPGE